MKYLIKILYSLYNIEYLIKVSSFILSILVGTIIGSSILDEQDFGFTLSFTYLFFSSLALLCW